MSFIMKKICCYGNFSVIRTFQTSNRQFTIDQDCAQVAGGVSSSDELHLQSDLTGTLDCLFAQKAPLLSVSLPWVCGLLAQAGNDNGCFYVRVTLCLQTHLLEKGNKLYLFQQPGTINIRSFWVRGGNRRALLWEMTESAAICPKTPQTGVTDILIRRYELQRL